MEILHNHDAHDDAHDGHDDVGDHYDDGDDYYDDYDDDDDDDENLSNSRPAANRSYWQQQPQ